MRPPAWRLDESLPSGAVFSLIQMTFSTSIFPAVLHFSILATITGWPKLLCGFIPSARSSKSSVTVREGWGYYRGLLLSTMGADAIQEASQLVWGDVSKHPDQDGTLRQSAIIEQIFRILLSKIVRIVALLRPSKVLHDADC